jgi:hypothetical protein
MSPSKQVKACEAHNFSMGLPFSNGKTYISLMENTKEDMFIWSCRFEEWNYLLCLFFAKPCVNNGIADRGIFSDNGMQVLLAFSFLGRTGDCRLMFFKSLIFNFHGCF